MSKDAEFDEETYAKAKPLFITVVNDLKNAHLDLRETIAVVVRVVGADAVQNMKPYVLRFFADVRDGLITLDGDLRAQTAQGDNQSTQRTMEGSRMRIEQHVVAAWANRLGKQAVSEVISSLEGMKAGLSGDSDLKNAWEEVCAQVQGEESIDWSIYEDTIERLLYAVVQKLDGEAQLALWAVTDEGWDYIYDHHADKNGAAGVPLDIGAIAAKLKGDVLSEAADYESPSLYRYIWGEDDPEYDEDEDYEEDDEEVEADAEEESEEDDDFADHVTLGIHREQIEAYDLESSLGFLRTLVPLRDPQYVWSWKGNLSVSVSGYDNDSRELYEIPEVRRYLQGLDQEWPFWFFFLTPSSIQLVGMCLASAVTVASGKAFIPPENFYRFMERGFGAVNHLFDHYGFPESENEALSGGVSQVFAN